MADQSLKVSRTCPFCRWSRDWKPNIEEEGAHGKCFYNPPTVVFIKVFEPVLSLYPQVYMNSPGCSKFDIAVGRLDVKQGRLIIPKKEPRGGHDGGPVV